MEIFKLFGSILINSGEAEKSIQKTDSKAQKLATTLGNGIKTAAKWGAGLAAAAAGAAVAVVGALLKIDEKTKEYRENQAKLTTAWEASGKTADLAKKAYTGLYAVIGDQDTATEAGQLLAQLASNAEDVAKWTDIAAGVVGTFGDALPINSLIEAANETAKVGKVTGALADALNWVGISEDAFNEKLAACSSEQERNRLITETLTQAYDGAAAAFEKNNAQMLAAREAQAKLDESLAKLGGAVSNVKTRLTAEFGPAIADIINSFVDFIEGAEGAETALRSSLENMVTKVSETLPSFLNLGANIILALVDGLVSNADLIVTTAFQVVVTLIDSLLSKLPEILEAGMDLLRALADGIMEYLPGLIERLPEIIVQIVQFFTDHLPEIVEIGVDIIVAIITGLLKALPDLLKEIPGMIADLVEAVGESLPDVVEAGKDIIGALWDGMKAIWPDVVGWVSEKMSWIADKLSIKNPQLQMLEDYVNGSHASGLAYVPYDNYRAVLHRGETVLNANDTMGFLDTIRSMVDAMLTAVTTSRGGEFVLNINGKEFYRASLEDLRAVEKANPEVATA